MKKRNWWKIGTGVGILFLIGILISIYTVSTRDPFQASIAKKILRFHVLANSDSEKDQELKEEVRDAVGFYLEPMLSDARSVEDTRRIINENLEGVIAVAEETIQEEGFSYGVTAKITHTDFPVKTYGEYTFPAGNYEALEVVIGKGEGHNWWCVLFPNMCFRGSVFEIVQEEAKESLQEVLSPEEYQDVFDSGKFKVKFRWFDFW